VTVRWDGGTRGGTHDKASYCRSFIDTRDSLLLIVAGGDQAVTLRQEMKSKGGENQRWGAEPWTCGNRSLVAGAVAFPTNPYSSART
jgi:hypothetical protein